MRILGLVVVLATAMARLDRVREARVLRVCIWPDYYSITYRNPKTQLLSGIDIDLAGELGKDLGVAVQFVDSSFAKLIDDVTQDRCDLAMFAVGITPARAEKLRFTRPYLASDIYAITTKTNRRIKDWDQIDRPGSVVAVAKGTLHESIMKDKLKAAQLLVLDTPFAREQEVQSGRADVFLTDYPYSQRFLASTDWARLVARPPAPTTSPPTRMRCSPVTTPGRHASSASSATSSVMGVCWQPPGGTNSRPSSPHDATRLAQLRTTFRALSWRCLWVDCWPSLRIPCGGCAAMRWPTVSGSPRCMRAASRTSSPRACTSPN
jgi:cyclohexadienyl dehydratase